MSGSTEAKGQCTTLTNSAASRMPPALPGFVHWMKAWASHVSMLISESPRATRGQWYKHQHALDWFTGCISALVRCTLIWVARPSAHSQHTIKIPMRNWYDTGWVLPRCWRVARKFRRIVKAQACIRSSDRIYSQNYFFKYKTSTELGSDTTCL